MKHISRISAFLLLLVSINLTAYNESSAKGYKPISAEELEKKINSNDDYTLLDVRTPGEFKGGHIKGAVNIAIQVLPREFKKVLPKIKKDSELILYCRTQNRSTAAAKYLTSLGYTNVRVYLGGWSTWSRLK